MSGRNYDHSQASAWWGYPANQPGMNSPNASQIAFNGPQSVPQPTTLYFPTSTWTSPPMNYPGSSGMSTPTHNDTSKPSSSVHALKNGAKTTSTRWTDKQTSVLVHEWKERIVELESSRATETWQKIVEEVNKHGSAKSIKQSKDKLRNLKQSYKEAKQNNNRTGTSPKTCPFYDEFDEVLGSWPVMTMPGVIDDGLKNTSPLSSSYSDIEEEDESSCTETTLKRRAEDDELFPKPPKKARKSKADAIESMTQQIIDMQKSQREMLDAAQSRTESLLVKLEMEQRKLDEESRRRDQEFFLRMAEILKK